MAESRRVMRAEHLRARPCVTGLVVGGGPRALARVLVRRGLTGSDGRRKGRRITLCVSNREPWTGSLQGRGTVGSRQLARAANKGRKVAICGCCFSG